MAGFDQWLLLLNRLGIVFLDSATHIARTRWGAGPRLS